MKKNVFFLATPTNDLLNKLLLAMKITIVLLVVCLHVSAGGFSQKVTIDARNTPVVKVLKEIERQSSYRFIYSNDLLPERKPVTIQVKNADLREVLDQIFGSLNLGYKILPEKVVIVTEPVSFDGNKETISVLPVGIVKGRITGDRGEPLEGASVSLSGKGVSAVSDKNGYFSFLIEPGEYSLEVSYSGYNSYSRKFTVKEGDNEYLSITLSVKDASLGEVVVIGYGNQARRKVTGAISKVNGGDLAVQRVSTPGEALAGLAAGVQVQANSGQPGTPPVIRIRGVRTLGDVSPLYVVDGFPLDNVNQFNTINVNDIESIEVLKDAASTAIYGSRGANGVVLVTTKKGKNGKTQFSFNANGGIAEISRKVELLSPQQYVEFAKQGMKLYGNLGVYPTIFDDPSRLSNTDWQDVIFRKAHFSDYQFSASGGTEKSHYFVSGGYFEQQGTLKGTSFKRYNTRFNFDTKIIDKVKVGIDFAPSFSEQFVHASAGSPTGDAGFLDDGSVLVRGQPGAVYTALLMAPVFPVKNANGSYFEVEYDPTGFGQFNKYQANFINPLAQLELTQHRRRTYRALTQMYLEYEPIKNLKLITKGGSSFDLIDFYDYYSPYWDRGGPLNTLASAGQPFAYEGQRRIVDLLWENIATYTHRIGENNITATAFYSLQDNTNKFNGTYGRDGTYTQLSLTNPLGSTQLIGDVSFSRSNFYSLGARINYDFSGKYLLMASIRQDGSSRFGPNKRSAVFPAASVGWLISEEKFMDRLKPTLSELKLRASYGVSGSANIGPFTWSAGSVGNTAYVFNNTTAGGAIFSGISNPDLTWERSRQLNLGVDAGFFNNKLTFSFEWYKSVNKDFLFSTDVPGTYGTATSYVINAGELENRGIELQVGTNLNLGPIKWSGNFNIGTYKNEVTDLNGLKQLPFGGSVFGWNDVYRIKVGESLGDLYGYKVKGVFRNATDLTNNPQWAAGGSKLGDFILDDFNKDGKIDPNDMQKLGNAYPSLTFGFSNTFTFKGFDLHMLVQGARDVDAINGTNRFLYQGFGNYNQRRDFFNNWYDASKPDRDVRYQRLAAGGTSPYPVTALTDRGGIEDASFIRLRNVTLGYSIPAKILQVVKVNSARIYFSGQNLVTITDYSGYNPEVSRQYASVSQPGIDMGAYPLSRIYTVGLSIGF